MALDFRAQSTSCFLKLGAHKGAHVSAARILASQTPTRVRRNGGFSCNVHYRLSDHHARVAPHRGAKYPGSERDRGLEGMFSSARVSASINGEGVAFKDAMVATGCLLDVFGDFGLSVLQASAQDDAKRAEPLVAW